MKIQIEIPELGARNVRSLIEDRFRQEDKILRELEAEGADPDHIRRVRMEDVTYESYAAVLNAINTAIPE